MFVLAPQTAEYRTHVLVVEVGLAKILVKVGEFLNDQLFLAGEGFPLLGLVPDNTVHFGPVGRPQKRGDEFLAKKRGTIPMAPVEPKTRAASPSSFMI